MIENIPFILFTFGYALIFGLLGIATFLIKIPKEKGMESYKKARKALGVALCVLSLYSIARLFFLQIEITDEAYIDFWLLTTFTLIHSWLAYSSLLFLMETPRYRIRHFLIDGGVPTLVILIAGIIGLYKESVQDTMIFIFGIIFGVKCIWMFHVCLREYRKCSRDLENYYAEELDIKWIRSIIYISLTMSVATVVAFYVPQIHGIYYTLIPLIYTYIVLKVVNFMPKKLDNVRSKNYLLDKEEAEKIVKNEKIKDLAEKIGPKVDEWIAEKNFCKFDLNIKDVASDIGTNHNYLSQYLNNNLGMTFQVWLNTLRIEESKKLLTSGEKLSIEEVGIKVGIPQSYNFSRWFRVVTNKTPYQYRKENNK